MEKINLLEARYELEHQYMNRDYSKRAHDPEGVAKADEIMNEIYYETAWSILEKLSTEQIQRVQAILDENVEQEEDVVVVYAKLGTPDTAVSSSGTYFVWTGGELPHYGEVVVVEGINGPECATVYVVNTRPISATRNMMKAWREEKEHKDYILTVAYETRQTDYKYRNKKTNILWNNDEWVPEIGDKVFVEGRTVGSYAFVENVEEVKAITDDEKANYELYAYPAVDDDYFTMVKVVYDEDEIEAYAIWKEEGEIDENGEWNHANDPIPGTICALRRGYKDYVEAHILEVFELEECELEELKERLKNDIDLSCEIGGVYKAYDHERMILHKYGFDPDEEQDDNIIPFN